MTRETVAIADTVCLGVMTVLFMIFGWSYAFFFALGNFVASLYKWFTYRA